MLAVFIDIIKKKSYIHGSFCDIIALAFSSSECSATEVLFRIHVMHM